MKHYERQARRWDRQVYRRRNGFKRLDKQVVKWEGGSKDKYCKRIMLIKKYQELCSLRASSAQTPTHACSFPFTGKQANGHVVKWDTEKQRGRKDSQIEKQYARQAIRWRRTGLQTRRHGTRRIDKQVLPWEGGSETFTANKNHVRKYHESLFPLLYIKTLPRITLPFYRQTDEWADRCWIACEGVGKAKTPWKATCSLSSDKSHRFIYPCTDRHVHPRMPLLFHR